MSSRLKSARSAEKPHQRADQAAAEQLLAAMAAARRALRRYRSRPVELSALTGAQTELVRLLRRRPGCSIADAAAELRLASNTVSTLVGRLTRSGVVVRTTDETDRRVARLDLAPDIRRKVDAWRDRRIVAVTEAIGTLPPDRRGKVDDTIALLEHIAVALAELDE